jgi:tetratricopeptide (TPR) repeat protein
LDDDQEVWLRVYKKKQEKANAAIAIRSSESRDEKIARLQKEIAENPNDPDNFSKDDQIVYEYLYRRHWDEKPDLAKGKEMILHCFEAYPQYANNWRMLELKVYLGNVYRDAGETDKAIETYCSVIHCDQAPLIGYAMNVEKKTKYDAEKSIDFVREQAISAWAKLIHKHQGGTPAVKALQAQRTDDPFFQRTMRHIVDGYIAREEK